MTETRQCSNLTRDCAAPISERFSVVSRLRNLVRRSARIAGTVFALLPMWMPSAEGRGLIAAYDEGNNRVREIRSEDGTIVTLRTSSIYIYTPEEIGSRFDFGEHKVVTLCDTRYALRKQETDWIKGHTALNHKLEVFTEVNNTLVLACVIDKSLSASLSEPGTVSTAPSRPTPSVVEQPGKSQKEIGRTKDGSTDGARAGTRYKSSIEAEAQFAPISDEWARLKKESENLVTSLVFPSFGEKGCPKDELDKARSDIKKMEALLAPDSRLRQLLGQAEEIKTKVSHEVSVHEGLANKEEKEGNLTASKNYRRQQDAFAAVKAKVIALTGQIDIVLKQVSASRERSAAVVRSCGTP
jgi:hypothetical protein